MISYMTGDLLNDDAQVLVNTVNCVGVMGRGIALQFKKKFPENFKAYKKACDNKEVVPGRVFVFSYGDMFEVRYIVNFPTKNHWKENSKIEYINDGLVDLKRFIVQNKITSIAIPPLGSGLGGLYWPLVKSRIEQAFADLVDVDVRVYEPTSNTTKKTVADKKTPNMTKGRAALLVLSQRYLDGFLDPSISLLEIHKLMFFLQEAGERLQLEYSKGHYGPYAENLRHVLNRVEGHFVVGYKDGGDNPNKQIELIPEAVKKAQNLVEQNKEICLNLNKVFDLVEGFESSYGLELLATVYWTIVKEDQSDFKDVQEYIYQWNDRKKQFTSKQIKLAQEHLNELGWLPF